MAKALERDGQYVGFRFETFACQAKVGKGQVLDRTPEAVVVRQAKLPRNRLYTRERKGGHEATRR